MWSISEPLPLRQTIRIITQNWSSNVGKCHFVFTLRRYFATAVDSTRSHVFAQNFIGSEYGDFQLIFKFAIVYYHVICNRRQETHTGSVRSPLQHEPFKNVHTKMCSRSFRLWNLNLELSVLSTSVLPQEEENIGVPGKNWYSVDSILWVALESVLLFFTHLRKELLFTSLHKEIKT